MLAAKQQLFASFRLDPINKQLSCGEEAIPLRRKTFEVLSYLVANPAQLVTKTALLDAVWPEVIVSDSMPTICVGELRKALGDEAKTPRFIETVHGRGYRFIAKVTTAPAVDTTVKPRSLPASSQITVGRERELALLKGWFSQVLAGQRRLVFVVGEPGIGKTTCVRVFLDSVAQEGSIRIGRGQCIEQYGAAEPYMPVLEALTRLLQESGGVHVLEVLQRLAPTWLAQMPGARGEVQRQSLQREAEGMTQQRMLREMAQALEALAADLPLVLFLEDLHWSDCSTLELLATIARRSEPVRLLVISTYRPVEMLTRDHPLRTMKGELELHHQCEELRLELLGQKDVADYLMKRFPEDSPGGARKPGPGDRLKATSRAEEFGRVASAIHDYTDGNPLFMENVVDYLIEQRLLLEPVKIDPPRSIVQMIERNLERLDPDEQVVLEAGSVVGATFSAAAVGAALARPLSEIEACCMRLSRQEQFVQTHGVSEWPDGTVAQTFRYRHALYADVLYGRIAAGRRAELHRLIAERQENAYGERADEIAAELAHRWRRANDKSKAIEYLGRAGQQAIQRCAQADAIGSLTAAIDLLKSLPDSHERVERELNLQLALAAALFAVRGGAAAELEAAYDRVRTLCQRTGNSRELFHALFGLWIVHYQRGELLKAYDLGEELLQRAQKANDPALLLYAHIALGDSLTVIGKLLQAREHFERGSVLCSNGPHKLLGGVDPEINCLSYLALVLLALGFPDQALQRSNQALASARASSNPYILAYAESLAGRFHQARHDPRATQEVADHLYAVSSEFGFSYWLAQATCERGGAIAALGYHEEGIVQIKQGLAAFRPTGAKYIRPPYLCLLAEACCRAGRIDKGLNALNEAFAVVNENGSPDMHRLKGELLLRRDPPNVAEAEHCFRRAIEIARVPSAKFSELRATTSLARLLGKQGRRNEARTMLAEIYGWFTEGFDTTDLKDAKALLDELIE